MNAPIRMAAVAIVALLLTTSATANAPGDPHSPECPGDLETIDFSTGVDANGMTRAGGSADDWTVTAGAGTVPRQALVANPPGAWVSAPGASEWISEHTNPASDYGSTAGFTTYEFAFTLTGNSVSPTIDITFAADNGVDFYLDGVLLGGYTGTSSTDHSPFNQLHFLSQPLALGPGPHALEAIVDNFGGPTGFVAEGAFEACSEKLPPPPPEADWANCTATAIHVQEKDLTGAIGDVDDHHSRAAAFTTGNDGPLPQPILFERPANPDAMGEAAILDFRYNNPFGPAVEIEGVKATCDVLGRIAGNDTGAEAIGTTTIEHIKVFGAGGLLLGLEGLTFDVHAWSDDQVTEGYADCDYVNLDVTVRYVDYCSDDNRGFSAQGQLATVEVSFNRQYGPLGPPGNVYGGHALQVRILTAVTEVTITIGEVEVALSGPNAQPIVDPDPCYDSNWLGFGFQCIP